MWTSSLWAGSPRTPPTAVQTATLASSRRAIRQWAANGAAPPGAIMCTTARVPRSMCRCTFCGYTSSRECRTISPLSWPTKCWSGPTPNWGKANQSMHLWYCAGCCVYVLLAVYAMRPRCLCEWWLVYQLEYGMIINLGFSLAFVYSNAICCAMPRFVHGMCIHSVNTLFLCCCPPRGNYIVHPSCHASGTSLIPRHFARHYPCILDSRAQEWAGNLDGRSRSRHVLQQKRLRLRQTVRQKLGVITVRVYILCHKFTK